jgi:hypothetical protein
MTLWLLLLKDGRTLVRRCRWIMDMLDGAQAEQRFLSVQLRDTTAVPSFPVAFGEQSFDLIDQQLMIVRLLQEWPLFAQFASGICRARDIASQYELDTRGLGPNGRDAGWPLLALPPGRPRGFSFWNTAIEKWKSSDRESRDSFQVWCTRPGAFLLVEPQT